jgi:2-dehydro-3-deoxy-D-gluconate 5-dehydrogenase
MKDLFSLKGKVGIVTGGNTGIGKGIARGFASAGGTIVIAARDQEKTLKVVKEIEEEFEVKALGLQVDVQKEDQVKKMVKEVTRAFGRIDILANNAGTNIRKMPQDYTLAEWDEVISSNLRSVFICSQAIYPSLKASGGGKIINIGSMTSLFGGAKLAAYGTSKGGVVQLTRSLAVAWAPDKIQVNAILPGWFNTERMKKKDLELPGIREHVVARTPSGRWGEPEDVSGVAIFLASAASDFLTGVALPLDGGFSIMI